MKYRSMCAKVAAAVFLAGVGWTLYEPRGLGPPVAFGGLVGGLVILGSPRR
jgi:hypothetical protein